MNNALTARTYRDKVLAFILPALTLFVVVKAWSTEDEALAMVASQASNYLLLPALLCLSIGLGVNRLGFIATGIGLAGLTLAVDPSWTISLSKALESGAFIAAFFTALACLRNAAASAPAIEACGRFLARQAPGRRYLALTVGGHLFGLILNYGSLVLLGSLAEASARQERDARIRAVRTRRMLLAVQRGFVSTLPWSPLAFGMAVSTSIIPGASWAASVVPCLVSAGILIILGWLLDSLFKPRPGTVPSPSQPQEGSWFLLWPLLLLLVILVFGTASLHLAMGVTIVGVVMLIVPLLSVLWIYLQNFQRQALGQTWRTGNRQITTYLCCELPDYRSELVLLIMAGIIGTLGSRLLMPWVEASGLSLSDLPAWIILVAIVWIIPLTGQFGMNPILSVSLFAPFLPEAAVWGVEPQDIILALTSGWALSGASSPFTATTLMTGAMAGVKATTVGQGWNGLYTVLAAILMSCWVAANALN